MDALSNRYIDEIQADSDGPEVVTLGSSNGFIQVEAVGLDKIRRKLSKLDQLQTVGLDECNISNAGSPEAIHKTIPG